MLDYIAACGGTRKRRKKNRGKSSGGRKEPNDFVGDTQGVSRAFLEEIERDGVRPLAAMRIFSFIGDGGIGGPAKPVATTVLLYF